MSIETQLLDSMRAHSPERQSGVLDFVDFVRRRSTHPNSPRPAGLRQGDFVVPAYFDAPLTEEFLRDFVS